MFTTEYADYLGLGVLISNGSEPGKCPEKYLDKLNG